MLFVHLFNKKMKRLLHFSDLYLCLRIFLINIFISEPSIKILYTFFLSVVDFLGEPLVAYFAKRLPDVVKVVRLPERSVFR